VGLPAAAWDYLLQMLSMASRRTWRYWLRSSQGFLVQVFVYLEIAGIVYWRDGSDKGATGNLVDAALAESLLLRFC
jgi:hypothetical protein